MQKILQLRNIYSLEFAKFMYKYNKSHLHATFNNLQAYWDVRSCIARQVKIR